MPANGGGIRADLEGDPATGEVNWGHLFTIQPFGNTLVTVDMTGGHAPIQVAGISYTWDFARPEGQRVVALNLANGAPVDPNATYKVVVNSFMATGGDELVQLKQLMASQTDTYLIDLDVAVDSFKAVTADQPLSYTLQNRAQVLNFPR